MANGLDVSKLGIVGAIEAARATRSWNDVIAARARHLQVTPTAFDDKLDAGEIALAAASYAYASTWPPAQKDKPMPPAMWPHREELFRPGTQREDLVQAAALLLAEIERVDRAAARGGRLR